jgi:hypothetical protein
LLSSGLTVVLLACGLAPLVRALRTAVPGTRLLALSAGLYALWAFFGQNILWQPRHLLPLAPFCALVMALGAEALWQRARTPRVRTLATLGALALLAPLARESYRLARLQSREPAPVARIAAFLTRSVEPARTLIGSAQFEGWLRHRAPGHRIVPVSDAAEARALGARAGLTVYVTSELPGAWEQAGTEVFRAQGDRYVWSTMYEVSLRRLEGGADQKFEGASSGLSR